MNARASVLRREARSTVLRDARVWLLPAAVLVVALVVLRVIHTPAALDRATAALFVTAVAYGLGFRAGGRATMSALLALLLAAGAVVTAWPPLLAGAALGTGVVVAVLGVLLTRPTASPLGVLRELLVAAVLGLGGGLAVAAWGVRIETDRFGLAVVGFALAGAVRLVYRLGVGTRGLDRWDWCGTVLALLALLAALAGPDLLRDWWPAFVSGWDRWFRHHLGATPDPVASLLGAPALVLGVRLRATRRTGWWWTGFGAAFTAPPTAWLLADSPGRALLGLGYGAVLGLLLGAVLALVLARRPGPGELVAPEAPRLHRLPRD